MNEGWIEWEVLSLRPAPQLVLGSQWRTARAVAPTSATARAVLMMRARGGSRSKRARDAPAINQAVQIRMIIAVSTVIFAAASVVAVSDRCALAKTAAIATHAFGLATPSSVPPTSEGACVATAWAASGGAVAMW